LSSAAEARRWLAQAEADLAAARTNAQPHPYVACFLAQQAAEKAMKAVQLASAATVARTHSLSELQDMLMRLGVTLEGIRTRTLRQLERLHLEARYPDALPGAIPAQYFTAEDAAEAIAIAADVVAAAQSWIGS
jgi:HEPN domain-containing protein